MKSLKFITALATSLLFSSALIAKPVELDTTKSSLKWLGKKVTGQHDGTIAIKSGSLDLDKSKITGGSFEIDMKSIKVVDIKDAEYNKKLTDHLNSEDFFNTEKFNTATFKIKEVKELKGNKDTSHELTGELTIKGITKPLTFPAKVEIKGNKATAKGKASIDRTLYEIKYGSGKFFQGLGDKMIHDTFEVEFDLATK